MVLVINVVLVMLVVDVVLVMVVEDVVLFVTLVMKRGAGHVGCGRGANVNPTCPQVGPKMVPKSIPTAYGTPWTPMEHL